MSQPSLQSSLKYTAQVLSTRKNLSDTSIVVSLSTRGNSEVIDTSMLFPGFVIDDGKIEWSGSNLTELCVALLSLDSTRAKPSSGALGSSEALGSSDTLDQSLRDFCEEYLTRVPRGDTLYKLACPEAIAPYRKNVSDAGFDLHLVRHLKSENGVDFYTTGVILEPPPSIWYMLVARSSMAKSGYVLANGVGIIDSSYRGEVIVALRKTSENSIPIELPARMVQVIPQQWFYTGMVEKTEVSSTQRGDQGGLGSHQFSEKV